MTTIPTVQDVLPDVHVSSRGRCERGSPTGQTGDFGRILQDQCESSRSERTERTRVGRSDDAAPPRTERADHEATAPSEKVTDPKAVKTPDAETPAATESDEETGAVVAGVAVGVVPTPVVKQAVSAVTTAVEDAVEDVLIDKTGSTSKNALVTEGAAAAGAAGADGDEMATMVRAETNTDAAVKSAEVSTIPAPAKADGKATQPPVPKPAAPAATFETDTDTPSENLDGPVRAGSSAPSPPATDGKKPLLLETYDAKGSKPAAPETAAPGDVPVEKPVAAVRAYATDKSIVGAQMRARSEHAAPASGTPNGAGTEPVVAAVSNPIEGQSVHEAAPPRVSSESLRQITVDGVRMLVARGGKTISVQLVPESLGELRLEVSAARMGSVHVRLISGNAEVREVLSAQLPALREALARTGVETTNVVVSSEAMVGHGMAGHHSNGTASSFEGTGRFAGPHARVVEMETAGQTPERASTTVHSGVLNVFV